MASWIAAATSYRTSNMPMIPFYIYYSMFGFQRVGDLAWAAGDMRARGFLLGGTSGRTTLNGEGLQHEDGHSHIISATIPNCVCYDPTYSYEVAVIIQDGLRRMYAEQEDVFYYLTLLNENYAHPGDARRCRGGHHQGHVSVHGRRRRRRRRARVQLLGSRRDPARGDRRRRAAGGRLRHRGRHLERDELHRAAPRGARRRALEHAASDRGAEAELMSRQCLDGARRPVIAATDYMKLFADQIRPFVPGRYRVLGTDGFGRSDYRKAAQLLRGRPALRVAVAALKALADGRNGPGLGRGRGDPEIRHRSRKAQSGHGLRPVDARVAHQKTAAGQSVAHESPGEVDMIDMIEVKVPDIGDFKDVPVIEISSSPATRSRPTTR